MTHSEPPRADTLCHDDPGAINSRPTPAVPLRAWSEADYPDDEPTSVIRADRLLAACEALKTSDTADLSGLRPESVPPPAADNDSTKVAEQKFWDGRPSHLALSERARLEAAAEQADEDHEALPTPNPGMSVTRMFAGALLLGCVMALAYQATLYFAPRSATIQALLQAIYKF